MQKLQFQAGGQEKLLIENQLLVINKDLVIQQQTYWVSICFAGFALIMLLGCFVIYNQRRKCYLLLQTLREAKEIEIQEAIMKGEEKERKRISRDLHDGIGGLLSAVRMHFGALRYQNSYLKYDYEFDHALEILDDAILEVRKTSHNLMPDKLNQHGLVSALEGFCQKVSHSSMLLITFCTVGKIQRFHSNYELSIYRVVQELITNIIKHSKATEAIVQLTQHNDCLTITVEDNGVGFKSISQKQNGIGLTNLKERITSLNGQLTLTTIPDSGTTAYMEFNISFMQSPDLQVAI
ncbi:sensor histidine kinase [Chitinophaga silvatica]|nr:sensor histidine kinase [Chitinophaga silvatica]